MFSHFLWDDLIYSLMIGFIMDLVGLGRDIVVLR